MYRLQSMAFNIKFGAVHSPAPQESSWELVLWKWLLIVAANGLQEAHVARLRGNLETGGDASLQNGLDLAVATLRSIPPYGHREVLMLYAALSTCDPGKCPRAGSGVGGGGGAPCCAGLGLCCGGGDVRLALA
jgi:hypothetical protein